MAQKISPVPLLNWLQVQNYIRWGGLLFWSVLLAASLTRNLRQAELNLQEYARITARTAFAKDVLYRRWSSNHGGVYVAITAETQPNPYLKDVPGRDITATNGTVYTLINPAYMTREVFELQEADIGVLGHITSLNPIRPQNAADPWETAALQAFENGTKEVSSVETLNGQSFMRLMRPLFVEERCLTCHAKQNYTLGQVRGGISESVPLTPLRTAGESDIQNQVIGHIVIWLAGIIGMLVAFSALNRSLSRQKQVEDKLVEMSMRDGLTGLFNRAYFEEFFRYADDLKTKPITLLVADIDGLKYVNDVHGHKAGDDLIQRAADMLQGAFRTEDIVARIGGDEFVVVLTGVDEARAEEMLARLCEYQAENNTNHADIPLVLSTGMATTAQGGSLEATFKLADQRMYAEKKQRKAKS